MWNDALVSRWPIGRIFIMSAPAGTGKTTLARKLVKVFSCVSRVPTLTTRSCRQDELSGEDYIFVSRQEFQRKLDQGVLLEHVEMHGELYGTPVDEVEKRRSAGKHVLLVIDTRGALALQKELDATLIFVHPPSREVLCQRLLERKSESTSAIHHRLQWAEQELLEAKKYHYQIVNDDFDEAFAVLASIVIAESHRTQTTE